MKQGVRTTMIPSLNFHRSASERGVALLLAIFALLLVSSVAIALIVASGTETSMTANYRSSTQVFYAGYAGLEEARGRMWPGNPNALGAFVLPVNGAPLAVNQVRYILNPSAGEVVQPANLAADNPYRDVEYQQEFGIPVTAAVVQTTNSVSGVAGLAGPLYKWVRITAKTERSAGIDTNGDGVFDPATPLFYDGANQNLTFTGNQVLRVTALAVLPDRSRRMLQYDIAPVTLNMNFAAPLTFDGYGDAFYPANSNVYWVNGNDNAGCGGLPTQPPKPAIGVPDNVDVPAAISAIPPNRLSHYIGQNPAPDVENVSGTMPPVFQTVSSLETLLATIKANATQVIQGPALALPDYGSQAAPTITYVQGDLTLQGNITGYGILVVTGNYTASGAVGWKGIVLVVGQGVMTVSGGGSNQYTGAVLIAKTRDTNGNILPSLGKTTLNWAGGGGNGVYYSSGCINSAVNNVTYHVLSFREIAQ